MIKAPFGSLNPSKRFLPFGSLTTEKLCDCGKLTFLTTEKIFFLNLEQNLNSLAFLQEIKSAEDLSTNIKFLMRDSNKMLFILNQIYSKTL